MQTLLLVHGGWSQASFWNRLTPELDQRAIPWRSMDLPGHGAKRRGSFWRISLRDYAQAVIDEAAAIGGPVIALGHSMGGLPIGQAAALAPGRFSALVFLAAFLLRDGERMVRVALSDEASDFGKAIRIDPLRCRALLDGSIAGPLIFDDCSEEDAEACLAALQPNPLRPLVTKVRHGSEFDRVPKHYILCTADRSISPAHQKWMADRYSLASFHDFGTNHMPMFANPSRLAQLLATIVKA
jgi:pimeloyl-ACP methyl ester carboxylesterase